MVIATFLACLGLLGPLPDEFQEQLARLGAAHAGERASAERWLEAHLVLERYPDLAETARTGDAEVRGRLTRILGSDDRHLALALELCVEKDAGLRSLGRAAVRASVARSDPRLEELPQQELPQHAELELLLQRAASASAPQPLVLDVRQSLGRMVEELELVGGLPIGLTLDPRVAALTIRRDEGPMTGAWNELLTRVAVTLGVTLELHGVEQGRRAVAAEGGFLHFGPRSERPASGVDLVSEWLFTLAGSGEEGVRRLAARNLVACGFTPALEVMDRLVRLRGDAAALEGLLVAAAKERVAPALLEAQRMGALLAEAEAQAGVRSTLILCALARVGCYDASGEALMPRLLSGFEAASSRSRWIRLFLMERNPCLLPGLEERVRALLADPATPAELRLQALHTLARALESEAPSPPRVENLREVFGRARNDLEQEHLGRTLKRLGLEPPLRDPSGLGPNASAVERGELLQAWLWWGETEPVAAHLVGWMSGLPGAGSAAGDSLAEELAPWIPRGAGARIDAALLRARALAPAHAAALMRVRLLLGLVPASEVPAVLAEGRFDLNGSNPDLRLLGALSGYPEPLEIEAAARNILLMRLQGAPGPGQALDRASPLFSALESAARGLYAAGRDEDGERLVSSVRQALRRPGAPRSGVLERSWPSAPNLEPLDLAALLARFEVPASL